jgi:hypothetical protein
MAGYSEQFLISLAKTESRSIGVKLAKLCTEANLPTLYIADKLGLTRLTIHSWFRGGKIRNRNKQHVSLIIKEIERGLEVGTLPVHSLKEAKEYLKRMPM